MSTVEDEIPMRYRMGKYADELSFTPHSPQQSAVDHAVQVLNPISVQFHQVRLACVVVTLSRSFYDM